MGLQYEATEMPLIPEIEPCQMMKNDILRSKVHGDIYTLDDGGAGDASIPEGEIIELAIYIRINVIG